MFDKDEQEISQIIDEGVEALLSGSATLEEFLAMHQDQAEVIRPELEAATWLFSREEQIKPRPGFVTASRKRVVDRIKREASEGSAKHAFFGFTWPKQLAFRWMAVVVIVVMLLSSTGGLVSASQSTLPGDGLYAIKRLSEEVNYNLTFSSIERVKYSAQLADRRIDELAALVSSGKVGNIEPALQAFERQINRTVALLQSVGNGQSEEQRNLAVMLRNDLNKHAEVLDALAANAPSDLHAKLDGAKEATLLGASMADNISKGFVAGATGTPVPQLTLTLTPGDTATMVNTPFANDPNDYLPTNTAESGTDLAAQPTDNPNSTLTPAGTSQKGNSSKVEKTPKVKSNNANPNAPGQSDNSGNSSNNGNSGNNGNNGSSGNNGNSGNSGSNANDNKDKTKESKN